MQKKRIPLYELITKLDSKEKTFIKKYMAENLSISSKKNYLDFYSVLVKNKNLTDENVVNQLAKNKLKNYFPEAKFYLNKLIVKALRIHYTIKPPNESDSFLSNLEKQKEIYIYFSKGLYKDAFILCEKYVRGWKQKNNFQMLSFAYKKMHQIELLTAKNAVADHQYHQLYMQLRDVSANKSQYYNLSLEVEKDLYTCPMARTADEVAIFENYLSADIMTNQSTSDIYFWYIQILCNQALLKIDALHTCFEQIISNKATAVKEMEIVKWLQVFSRLTFIAISINNDNYYNLCKNEYLSLITRAEFLTDRHKIMYQLNATIMDCLYLFKQKKYVEMLKINTPQLDIDNYIFEGAIMLQYVNLILARGKAHFKLSNFDKAYDYFNFILTNKLKFKADTFTICNAFFHIWLIRYASKEYKVLPSLTNRFKLFLSHQKINFLLEKALLKFMYSVSHNYSAKNRLRNVDGLIKTLNGLHHQAIEKHLIKKIDIMSYLIELKKQNKD